MYTNVTKTHTIAIEPSSDASPLNEMKTPPKIRRNFQRNTYDRASIHEIKGRFSPAAKPPLSQKLVQPAKAPRTFAHDIYVQEKAELKLLVESKYQRTSRDTCKRQELRRRSRSVEPVYDRPLSLFSREKCSLIKPVEPYQVTDIFKPKKNLGAFEEESKCLEEEAEQVVGSLQEMDLKKRVAYAQTLKKTFSKSLLTQYASISNLVIKEPSLTKYVMIYDKKKDSLNSCPSSAETTKLVLKLASECKTSKNQFFWITFSKSNTLYTYFLSSDERMISLASELCSPQFFMMILQKMARKGNLQVKDMVVLNKSKIPLPGDQLDLNGISIKVPFDTQMTLTNPSCLINSLGTDLMLKCFGTLLQEKRVVLVSSETSKLIDVSVSLVSLLYPLVWDYMFWPVVPNDSIVFTAAITDPYLIGIRAEAYGTFHKAVEERGLKLLIIDLDQQHLISCDGTEALPKKSSNSLKKDLKLCQELTSVHRQQHMDSALREAFMQFFLQLLGPVTPYISELTFAKSSFIKSLKSKSEKTFFRWFSETLLFESFVKSWQLRGIHSSYMTASGRILSMGSFERRTETHRLNYDMKKLESQKRLPKLLKFL